MASPTKPLEPYNKNWDDNCFPPFPLFTRLIESSIPHPILVRVLSSAAIDDGCLFNRRTHRPVNPAPVIKIGEAFAVEPALVAMLADVLHQVNEKLFIDPLPDDVLVRPFRHGPGKGPMDGINKGDQVGW
jgi:hypothetical protein